MSQAIEGFLELPRHLWEFQAFPAIPRQLGDFSNIFLQTFNSGKLQNVKKSVLKTKLGLPNPALSNTIATSHKWLVVL